MIEDSQTQTLANLLAFYKEEGVNPQLNLEAFRKSYQHLKEKKTPILVQLLMFIGALLGAGFLLGFLALTGIFETAAVLIIFGIVIMIIGLAIPFQSDQAVAVEPISMAFLMIGCTLFAVGFNMYGYDNFIAFLVVSLLISMGVLIVAASHLQKISAVFCANLCAYWLIWEMNIGVGYNFIILLNAAVVTIACLREPYLLAQAPKLGQWYTAILNGCSVSMIMVLTGSVNASQSYHWRNVEINPSYWWLSSLLLVGLVLWALNETLDLFNETTKKIPILIAVGLALLILIKAPGIIAGILLLFLGIYGRYYLFAIQGILAIFFFVGMFYYNMDATFLFKSVLAISAGLIFMGLGYAIKRVHDAQITKSGINGKI